MLFIDKLPTAFRKDVEPRNPMNLTDRKCCGIVLVVTRPYITVSSVPLFCSAQLVCLPGGLEQLLFRARSCRGCLLQVLPAVNHHWHPL